MGSEKCASCGKKGRYRIAHAGISFCAEHFSFYVEKKAKQAIREFGTFENKRIGVLLDRSAGSETLMHIMKGIANERGTELVGIRKRNAAPKEIALLAKRKRLKFVVTGHCTEDFVLQMLLLCVNRKPEKLVRLGPKEGIWGKLSGVSFPAPLFRVYGQEAEEYAKLHGLSFSQPKQKNGLELALSGFIEKMESEHPGTKHKMLKSLLYYGKRD